MLVCSAGDNMLTALSVARECCMVDRTDRIILVQAYPPQDGKAGPQVEFVYADEREKKVEEVMSVVSLKNLCFFQVTFYFYYFRPTSVIFVYFAL